VAQKSTATNTDSKSPTARKPRKRAAGASAPDDTAVSPEPGRTEPKPKPHGREQVIESIIDATLSLWSAKGPAEVSLRSIAARAGVNYGLVYRHFKTKEAVIRAATDRVVARSMHYIEDSDDLVSAMDKVLPRSTGAHARLLAWAILQYVVDDVMPAEDVFLKRLQSLAKADIGADGPDADAGAKVKAGSMLAMLYGWRLFEPYLVRGLQLEQLSHDELDAAIRDRMLKALSD
jgi:TetR/AcrR family transcriptional regulator, repressor for neighboring sulfatase